MIKPACMDEDEYAGWQAHNQRVSLPQGAFAESPCQDCMESYAAEMRNAGRCDGEPGGEIAVVADQLDVARSVSAEQRRLRKLQTVAQVRELLQLGMSQAAAARHLGISERAISNYKAQGLLT